MGALLETSAIPFYLNWSFWTVLISLTAVVLSQFPPVKYWFRRAKLTVVPHSKISLTHKAGNPNVELHLIVTNVGGRSIRVQSIEVSLERDGSHIATLPVQNYLLNQNDTRPVLFTGFPLRPEEEWAHIVYCLNFFNREDESEYRELEKKIINDLSVKRSHLDKDSTTVVEIDPGLAKSCEDFFNRKYIWKAGDYKLCISVKTNCKNADSTEIYRFTLFESHASRLSEITENFKYGEGFAFDSTSPLGVIVDIHEAY